MKKQYISPLTRIVWAETTNLCTHSITGFSGTEHEVETNGDADAGSGSDSRRHRNLWDDEEEEYY